MNKQKAIISLVFLSSALIFSGSIFAQASPRPSQSPGSQADTRREQAENRLQDAKLKSCQAKEDSLKRRSTRLTNMANIILAKFATIASRVEEYYNTKVVPSGKTVSNYDSLVSDMESKNSTVKDAISLAQTDVAGFSCTGDDPKGQMIKFREDMQNTKNALQEFRTSIKNLIVAIHSSTGGENSASPSSKVNRGNNND